MDTAVAEAAAAAAAAAAAISAATAASHPQEAEVDGDDAGAAVATGEMGPSLTKDMYEARRTEGIRAVFRLAALILLRSSGDPVNEPAGTLTAAYQHACEYIPG